LRNRRCPLSGRSGTSPDGQQDSRQTSDGMTGDSAMAQYMSGDPDAHDGFVRLDDGDIHVAEDGTPGAPAVLLIHGTGASTAWWDPVVAPLAGARRVIRGDLAGHGGAAGPARAAARPSPAPPAA